MPSKVKNFTYNGQNVYVGIDTHLKNWRVSIILDHLEMNTFSQNPNARDLARYLKRNFPGCNYYSAYEAGFCGFSVHNSLIENGINNIIANPSDIPTTDKERKQKNDSRDSLKIARSLRNGGLKAIHVPQRSTLEFRSLVRYRKTLVKEITRNKNRIKSALYFYGIPIPAELDTASKYWSGRFSQWIRNIELETKYGKPVFDSILDSVELLRKKLLDINRILRNARKEGEYAPMLQNLCTIHGIGLITAVTFVSEIEIINRFNNLDKLCSYVGLIPTTHSSGEKDINGKITPRSNKPLRSVLIEAAWMAIRSDPHLGLMFNDLTKRMKGNEAIIRIAKKLLNRIRFVMKNETAYVNL